MNTDPEFALRTRQRIEGALSTLDGVAHQTEWRVEPSGSYDALRSSRRGSLMSSTTLATSVRVDADPASDAWLHAYTEQVVAAERERIALAIEATRDVDRARTTVATVPGGTARRPISGDRWYNVCARIARSGAPPAYVSTSSTGSRSPVVGPLP